jgi:hypothetical protein
MFANRESNGVILFLDFDGVLHHHDVMVERIPDRTRIPIMQGPGELFQWVPQLESVIAPHPDVQIVLSTKWVWWFGIDYCRSRLPDALAARVIGATWEGGWAMPLCWIHWDRCRQIRHHVDKYAIDRWLAIDDDDHGLFDEDRANWVVTDPSLGVAERDTMRLISEALCP